MTNYRFGNALLIPAQRQLQVDGKARTVGPRAFDVLLALVERRERLVTKNELLDLVWPGVVVEENNLQVHISALRKLLGPQAIATIPGRGYRFAAGLDGEQDADAVDGNSAAQPVQEVKHTTPHTTTRALTNIPGELPPLYGRDVELQAVCALLDEHRLVTVVGAGGMGKSRLAQAAAHAMADRCPDGAWMVELAGLFDPALIPNVVARTLGITIPGQGAALEELASNLAQRKLLLVLDNCEHMLDGAARLAQGILHAAPGVTLLATSQEPLRLAAEQQYRLSPLAVPIEALTRDAREFGAPAMFEARVRAALPGFALTPDNLPVVIDICRRLDGLPLAIELAAARVATLGLGAVRDKLDARFRLLTGGSRSTLRRHQTLRAALEWSHQLLTDDERAVFRRLGVFAGGFTMEMAQAVAADAQLDEWAVLDQLSALVEKSLVVADPGDTPRYRLLESARAFALEQLAEGETAQTLRRHAMAVLDFLERVDGANLDGELRSDKFAALALPELDNLRAARAWAVSEGGDPLIAIALAAHAGSLIDYTAEIVDWLLPLIPQMKSGGRADVAPGVAARFWRAMAAYNMVGRILRSEQMEASCRALAMYRAVEHPRRIFSSLIQLTSHRIAQQDNVAAQESVNEARSLLRPDWPAEFLILLLRVDASIAEQTGRQEDATAMRREAVRVSVSSGDWRHEVIDRSNLVDSLWRTGPIEAAADEISRLAAEIRARPAPDSDMASLYANLIGVLSEMGRIDEATAAAREAIPVMRRSRYTYIEEWVYLFWRRGQLDTAALLLGACDEERRRFGTPHQENERRLVAAVRAGLETQLRPAVLASAMAAGAALDERDWLLVITAALELQTQRLMG